MLHFSSVQSLSRVWLFATPLLGARQASLSIMKSQSSLRVTSFESVMPSSISSSVVPFSSCLHPFQHQGLFQWVSSLHQVAKVLELQLQHQSFQSIFSVDFLYNEMVWSLCSLRDSQESFPTQFESINSSMLSLLYGPTFTSIHDYWKDHSFDYADLCW